MHRTILVGYLCFLCSYSVRSLHRSRKSKKKKGPRSCFSIETLFFIHSFGPLVWSLRKRWLDKKAAWQPWIHVNAQRQRRQTRQSEAHHKQVEQNENNPMQRDFGRDLILKTPTTGVTMIAAHANSGKVSIAPMKRSAFSPSSTLHTQDRDIFAFQRIARIYQKPYYMVNEGT